MTRSWLSNLHKLANFFGTKLGRIACNLLIKVLSALPLSNLPKKMKDVTYWTNLISFQTQRGHICSTPHTFFIPLSKAFPKLKYLTKDKTPFNVNWTSYFYFHFLTRRTFVLNLTRIRNSTRPCKCTMPYNGLLFEPACNISKLNIFKINNIIGHSVVHRIQ